MQATLTLIEETAVCWRLEPVGDMRVPGIVFATERLLPEAAGDESLRQVANVATLPGVVEASYAMPDVHWGYGFPIGGVAATDVEDGGVVSPGGVGFDISCGVRLLVSQLSQDDLRPNLGRLMDELGQRTPRGPGPGGVWRLKGQRELEEVLTGGSRYAVERGHGVPRDLDRCEDGGAVGDADPAQVGARAMERGLVQVGSLGSGNHFLEVQTVDVIFDETVARAFGLRAGQVCVMIHCGSRGLGHQICTDYVQLLGSTMARYGITVPDPQLACTPVRSPEGTAYLGAMAAAANYGRANRQLLTEAARQAFEIATGTPGLDLLYDVSHNLAKLERHSVDQHGVDGHGVDGHGADGHGADGHGADGRERLLCVHRKGATLALPPHHPGLPADLAAAGQPVLVPGSMGTASYVLTGTTGGGAFHSACHGAGRVMSRHAAVRKTTGKALERELERSGIAVRALSGRGLAEEAPFSYKDVDEVVDCCERAGLARRVARLRPIGVVKG